MTALFLVLLVLLVLLNGLFVAAEFALVRTRKGRIENLAKEGEAGAEEALEQLDKIDESLAACQFGITLASIGIGFLGEPAIADLIEPVLGDGTGATAVAFAIAFTIATALHITIGEQVPKMLAITNPDPIVRGLSRPLSVFRTISAPFTFLLNKVSNAIVRLFGVDPRDLGEKHTSDDLKEIIRTSAKGGSLDPGEAVMLGGVFHLHEQEAREVMTPIPAVVTVNADETVEEALRRCVSSGHTRLVVVEDDNPDKVRGIVHNNSLVRLYLNAGGDASLEPAIREVPVFPETKPIDDLLAELQRQRSSIGIVSDEYGRTVGIVTVEDILEEVVGEIEDETDPRAVSLRRLTDGDWYVRGHVPLGDLEDAGIELPVDSDAFNSIGGYVFSELGRRPKRGDKVRANGYELRVEVGARQPDRRRPHPPGHRRAPDDSRRSGLRNTHVAGVERRSYVRGAAYRPRRPVSDARGRHMWVVKLTDKQLEVLRAMLRSEEHLGPALRGALEALELARWDELPDAQLPWASVADEARRQGVSEAEVVWDLCGRIRSRRRRAAGRARPPRAARRLSPTLQRAALTRSTRRTPRRTSARACPRRPSRGPGRGTWSAPPPAPSRVEALADRRGDVEADEVEQLQRAHRVPGAEPHAGVDVVGAHPGRLHQPHRLEQVGEQQPVDDEARPGRGPRSRSCPSPGTRRARARGRLRAGRPGGRARPAPSARPG